jgi:hypothetical protein
MGFSFRVEGNIDLNSITRSVVNEITDDYLREVRKNTPKKTGKARSGWRKKFTRNGAEINNKVEYISYLDEGISKQAPDGFHKPTLDKIAANSRAGKYDRKRKKGKRR